MNDLDAWRASPLELRHFRYFLAVAEEGHFGRAADRVCVAQPAISRQIQQLEEELGVRLFDRARQGTKLTDAGRQLAVRTKALLRELHSAVSEIREVAGAIPAVVRVGFVEMSFYSGIIPAFVQRFRSTHPNVRVELVPASSAQQRQMLEAGAIDVGLMYHETPDTTAYAAKMIGSEPLMLAIPQNHALARRRAVALRDLQKESFIWFPRPQNPAFYDHAASVCAEDGLQLRIVQDGANDPTQLTLVGAGIGLSFTPRSAQRTKPDGVSLVEIRNQPLQLDLYAVSQAMDQRPVVTRFVAELAAAMASSAAV